jgi:hypothetical protein
MLLYGYRFVLLTQRIFSPSRCVSIGPPNWPRSQEFLASLLCAVVCGHNVSLRKSHVRIPTRLMDCLRMHNEVMGSFQVHRQAIGHDEEGRTDLTTANHPVERGG